MLLQRLMIMITTITIFTTCCFEKPKLDDWTGNYTGRDFMAKTGNNGIPLDEPTVDANVSISDAKNDLIKNDIDIDIELLFEDMPVIINLPADIVCEENSLIFREKGDFRPELLDDQGNKFTLEYSGATAKYINDSKDVEMIITEKKIYDNSDLSDQNFTITHTIKLNKQ